jgi:hypothetical protein
MEPTRKKGTFTFRTAAVFFILSAVLELPFVTSEVPLFGAVRDGLIADVYHIVYVLLFTALGVGLWNGVRWAFPTVFITTVYYSLDTIQAFFSREAAEVDFKRQLMQILAGQEAAFQQVGVSKEDFMNAVINGYHNMISVLPFVLLACWLGFAWYTYRRRDYFSAS